MARVDIGGNVVEFPDSLSPEGLQSAVASAAKQLGAGSHEETPAPSLARRAGDAALTVAKSPFDLVAAPFQVVGEALRMPIEGDSNFRAPTILQKIGIADKTAEPPADPINLANRLVRAGAAGVSTGNITTARNEYHRPADLIDTGTDVAAGILSGKLIPNIANAPIEAIANAPAELGAAAKATASGLGKKLVRVMLGPSTEAQSARYANPAAFKAAPFEGGVADDVANTANTLSKKISEADTAAWNTLRTSYDPYDGAVHKSEVMSLLKDAKDRLKVFGGGIVGRAAKGAIKAIGEIEKDIQEVGKHVGGTLKSQQGTPSITRKNTYLPEQSVKGILQALDQNIDWDAKELQPVNELLETARVGLDGRLKGQNTNYKQAMEPVAEMMDALTGLKRKFNLSRVRGEGFAPSDATINNVKSVGRREMPETGRVLGGVKKYTGHDVQAEANTARLKREFNPTHEDRARGSARTLSGTVLGNAIGWLTGHPAAGSLVGAATGRLADVYGGAAAGELIDATKKGSVSLNQLMEKMKGNPNLPAIASLLEQIKKVAPAAAPASSYRERR
jgi:hypothetical protein